MLAYIGDPNKTLKHRQYLQQKHKKCDANHPRVMDEKNNKLIIPYIDVLY